jgi:phosphate-selective porin OprO and OprP
MNRPNGWAVLATLSLLQATAASAQSADDSDLQKRLETQEQRIKVLERKLEIQDENTTAAVASTPVVKASSTGFSVASADGQNTIRLRGNFAFDGRWYSDSTTPQTADTFLFRRVRPYVEGTLASIYDFRFMPDFGGGKSIIVDAFAAARFKPYAVITAGKFKGPVGLERLQPDQYNRFLELGLPSVLVPNRDLGVQYSGEYQKGVVAWQLGVFNGTTDGVSSDTNASPDADNDGRKHVDARVFLQPFLNSSNFALRGLGVGLGGSAGKSRGSATSTLLPTYKTPGQQNMFAYSAGTFSDGDLQRISPQAYYYVGRYGFLGEYVKVKEDLTRVNGAVRRSDTLKHDAWQFQFATFLTGEDESYAAFTPNNNFAIGKPGWGAIELALRVHQLTLDDATFTGGANSFANPATSPHKATAAGIGLNWYFTQTIKWQLDYEVTRFDGGAAAGADKPDEKAILTRVCLVF